MKLNLFRKLIFICLAFLLSTSAALGQWSTKMDKDEMTGKHDYYAVSPAVNATEKMSDPYTNTKAWLIVHCRGQRESALIGFTQSPNISGETHDGFDEISTRIKFDDKISKIELSHEWGSRFLEFYYDYEIISSFIKSDSVLFEINWFGQGRVYFRFPMKGSALAIEEIRNKCSNI